MSRAILTSSTSVMANRLLQVRVMAKSWVVLVSLVSISLLGVSTSVRAATWTFPDANCSITTPDGWETVEVPKSTVRITVASADGRQGFCLGVEVLPDGVDHFSNEVVQHIKRTVTERGGVVLSDRAMEIEGLAAVEISFRDEQLALPRLFVQQYVIANGSLYTLSASGISGEATADAVLQSALASFSFLEKPTPNRSPGRSRAFVVGHYLGYYFFPVVIIGGMAFGLYLYYVLRPRNHRHRHRSRRR